ncbi:MAG: DUF748 domain-containing protein [Moraxellaceae bacterium]|nr:DUF748 domain-containing protein [Pseudobdellovibrionaceae bacterium]
MKLNFKYIILIGVIILLCIIRFILPSVILKKTNAYLENFSEDYYAHVGDFDLSLWRGAYRFDQVIITLKEDTQKPFATAASVDVSISWSQLFQGRVLTDVVASEVNLIADQTVSKKVKSRTKESVNDAKQVKRALFPVEVERIEIRNSRIEYRDMDIFADQIEGRLSHVTATEIHPVSLLTLKGLLLGKAPLKAVSTINMTEDPVSWVVALEIQKLNLVETNPFTNRYLPLTFGSGILDIYSEVKSENGYISGYLKPFLKDGDVIGDPGDFKGLKHLGIELSAAALNFFFRSNDKHIVATKILFSYENGNFEWNMSEAITQLFKNGYQEELNPGLENRLTLAQRPATKEKK